MILNAKCHAIRDAQILEKRQIVGEMTEEEKRLDTMMEVDRQNAIKIQEEIEKRRKEERLMGAAKLLDQIQENEQERLFDLERKDQENIQMQKYIEKMMDEDRVGLEKKKVEQTSLRVKLLIMILYWEIFAPCFFSQFAVLICIHTVLISRFVKSEKNKMLIVFQTVKQLLFTTIRFQRCSHLHINVNEVSSNHLFDLKTCIINHH